MSNSPAFVMQLGFRSRVSSLQIGKFCLASCLTALACFAAAGEKADPALAEDIRLGRSQSVLIAIDDKGLRDAWLKKRDECWADSAASQDQKLQCSNRVTTAYQSELSKLKENVMARHPKMKVTGQLELGPQMVVDLSELSLLNDLLADQAVVSIARNHSVGL